MVVIIAPIVKDIDIFGFNAVEKEGNFTGGETESFIHLTSEFTPRVGCENVIGKLFLRSFLEKIF